MNIRKYKREDKDYLINICIETSSKAKSDPIHKVFTTTFYCQEYLENELAYVLEDKQPVGYLLVASNYDTYEKHMKTYFENIDVSYHQRMKNEMEIYRYFKNDYPAHLHIDLLAPYRKGGNGSKLMVYALDDLKKKHVKGIMLGVSKENVGAIHFYQKFHFEILAENKDGYVMGLKLKSA